MMLGIALSIMALLPVLVFLGFFCLMFTIAIVTPILRRVGYSRHPLGSPMLGIIVSRVFCLLGHDIVVAEFKQWDRDWLACSRCGARFVPVDMLGDETPAQDSEVGE